MPSSDSFFRQLSGREGWKSTSKRWGTGGGLKQMEGLNMYYGNGGGGDQNGGDGGMMMRKRVMVVVDQSSHSKHAMIWALTHVTNMGGSRSIGDTKSKLELGLFVQEKQLSKLT
ncbi:hypothetical protein LOK49_LG11G02253 [Camellia lanceoleosa]|uniref:Uncharacterized protein n=1 Tax=Camellia lanceoleosa TaxID=1840588 RepID=A0ACC0FZN9_9ERIC|nr:hypothetical protein LOK49_LG11G02253 [Camellia lanceoleosa]